MKTIFADPTPRWVPFAAAGMILIGVWFAGFWENLEITTDTRIVLGLAVVMFIAILCQGRFFWKGGVEKLSTDGMKYEAVTSVWVGRGKRVTFGPTEASDWTANAKSGKTPPELSSIYFTVGGKRLDMSFVNPKVVDVGGLTAINPSYFAKVKADYPTLTSVG